MQSSKPDPTMMKEDSEASMPSNYALYRQQSGAPLRQLYFHRPVLIVVSRGSKTITIDKTILKADVGDVIVASAGCFATVINTPDSAGLYEADLFTFGSDLVMQSQVSIPGALRFGSFAPPVEFDAARNSARDALLGRGDLPARVVTHRVGELLAWAREYGIYPTISDPHDLAIRVRAVISRDPSRNWRISEVASALAMSEPTLRRHLAANGTSASEIIADVRLTRALTQLQSSTTAITQIAADAGYDSPSRFAARFRARFGVAPGEIRGRRSQNERIGTELDRTRVAAD